MVPFRTHPWAPTNLRCLIFFDFIVVWCGTFFWFLWYFGHQFWGDWCQKSISRRPQFWPRDWYFWINDHGPMSPSIFSHFAVGLFGFSRGEVLMNTDDYWMNVLLLLDWSRLCLCKIENYGQEMNNAKMPNKRTHKHTLTCSDCLGLIWAVHSCSNLCWICFKLGYLEAFGGLEGDSIFRELMGFMEITCLDARFWGKSLWHFGWKPIESWN